ncbi:MAG: LamG-like jellyroll fold domain-containing protein [Verrucomicrobiia bacterium]
MKIQKNIKWVAAMAAVCLAAHTASAQNMIGVNFVANDNPGGEQPPGGAQNGWVDSLEPTDMAGVYPQKNWNNLGRFGDSITLNDGNGVSSGVNIAWTALGVWHCSGQPGFPPLTNGNAKLMDGFLESTWGFTGLNGPIAPGTAVTNISNCAPIIFLSGLQQFIANQCGGSYSIVIYCNNDTASGRHSEYWIDAVSGTSSAIVVGAPITPPIFHNDNAQFTGTFTQVCPSATNDTLACSGNYIEFDGLTNDEILIVSQNITGSPAAVINGIQVVALGVMILPTVSPPGISPTNVIFPGTTVTISANAYACGTLSYQWQTDSGGGGSLTNIPGATDSSLVTTPTTVGTWNYDVVVTNNYGSLTSILATVTVLPASAPMLTSDIGQYNTNVFAFVGGSVNFYANFGFGNMPITNQWLFDNGSGFVPIAGATSSAWTVTNVQSSSAGNYELAATNAIGWSNSTPAHLTDLADPPAPSSGGVTNMYSYCVMTNHPWAYWKFEETNDTLTSSMQAYDYSGHNFDATYGNSDGNPGSGCLDGGESILAGQYGPGNGDSYSGFPVNNGCATMSSGHNNGYLTVPPLNLNTNNNVTFTLWIYIGSQGLIITPGMGLFMNRNGSDAAGVGFGANTLTNAYGVMGSSVAELGYTWNSNSASTYGWHSGLYPCPNTWNFVACTITPTNTAMYLYYVGWDKSTTNLLKAVQSYMNNIPEAFGGGTTWIGSDNWNNANSFDGSIDEVAVFTNALTETQIQSLFLRSLGLTTGIAPYPIVQPTNQTLFMGQTLQLTFIANGIPSPWYQWQYESGTTWSSLGTAVGRTPNASTLVYSNWVSTSYTNFRCIATNYCGATTSSVATVTLIPVANWNKGLWTVNFAIKPPTNTPYYGRGVLGTNYYWNALSGSPLLGGIIQFTNTPPSLLDDGVTASSLSRGINFGSTNQLAYGLAGTNNALLDTCCYFGPFFEDVVTNGTAFVFTGVPCGIYNLALYGIDGAGADNGLPFGTTFTVQGISQSVINAQDAVFLPDNTVIYTNLMVTNGTLEVDMMPALFIIQGPGPDLVYFNQFGAFNGAQLELIKWGPNILSMTNKSTNMVLTYVGGQLLEATNISGPWTTNLTATSPFTVSPTGQMKFYRIYTNSLPH